MQYGTFTVDIWANTKRENELAESQNKSKRNPDCTHITMPRIASTHTVTPKLVSNLGSTHWSKRKTYKNEISINIKSSWNITIDWFTVRRFKINNDAVASHPYDRHQCRHSRCMPSRHQTTYNVESPAHYRRRPAFPMCSMSWHENDRRTFQHKNSVPQCAF